MTASIVSWSEDGWNKPTVHCYQASRLESFIYFVRLAMEDEAQYIGVVKDGQCIGFWEDDAEPEPDGEGGWCMARRFYVLQRPDDRLHYALIAKRLEKASTQAC